jgi:PST family polysaccharide transporter/lipopolysaccharide exporter
MTSLGDLRQRTFQGLAWQFVGMGGQRVVQFVGIAAMAWLLPPQDIGLFGIVLVGIAAVEALTAFLGEQSQIHSPRGAERAYLDTVFTVRLVRGFAVTGALMALAPAMAWFFADPARSNRCWLTGLFLALSLNSLADAVQSPARAARIKELQFRRVAIGDLAAAMTGTGLQIALAYCWRDVWALVVGQIATTLARSVASYVVAPYLPRLCLERAALKELLRYSLGGAGTPFLLMLIAQAPALVLGKLYNDIVFGIYTYCERLSKLPEEVSLRVLAPVAIPAYAKLAQEPQLLANGWLSAMRAILLVGLPGTVVLVWVGNDLPAFVFGADYGAVAWLFPVLALRGGIAGINSVIGPLFWAIGEPHKDRAAQLARTIVVFSLGIPLATWLGPAGFAMAAGCATSAALLLSLRFALRRLELPLSTLGAAAAPGAAHAVALAAGLLLLDATHVWLGPMRVAVGGVLGALVLGAGVYRSGLLRRVVERPA